MIYNILRGNYE